MNKYDVYVVLGREEIPVRVKAPTLDAAMRQVKKMTVLQLLEGKTLGQLDMVRGASSVERP